MRKACGMLALALASMGVTPAGADYEAGQRAWEVGRPES